MSVDDASLKRALKTTANSNGSFSVQVWNFRTGGYGPTVVLSAGVNFIKLGSVSTFLESGDPELAARAADRKGFAAMSDVQ